VDHPRVERKDLHTHLHEQIGKLAALLEVRLEGRRLGSARDEALETSNTLGVAHQIMGLHACEKKDELQACTLSKNAKF
jgi:hypothetical protein